MLADLAPRLGRVISKALESDEGDQLTLRQYRLLERLTEHPHRTTELAATSGVSQATASSAISALESRGWVQREPDPEDGRATLLVISDEGLRVWASGRERVLRRLGVVTAQMQQPDADALRALYPILAAGMDRLRDGGPH